MGILKFTEIRNKTIKSNNVKHIKATGKIVNDSNIESIQEINILVKDENIEMGIWSMFENGKYRLGHVQEIAKNFEKFNNDYIVIAAVNADYFYMRSVDDVPVNASVIFNNKVLNAKNHDKYQALKFNSTSTKLEIIKQTKYSETPILYVYKQGKLIFEQEIYINDLSKPLTIVSNQETNTGFNIEVSRELIYDNLFFLEGKITNNITNYCIISNTNLDFDESNEIKIQYKVTDIESNEMLVGFDGVILKKGKVLSFNEMRGQNFEHNSVRHPRTAIGIHKSGKLVLAGVDGRQVNSEGVDNREFAEILRSYGLVDVFNLDGGGSTQIVFRIDDELEIINKPSEYPLRPVTNAILFLRKK